MLFNLRIFSIIFIVLGFLIFVTPFLMEIDTNTLSMFLILIGSILFCLYILIKNASINNILNERFYGLFGKINRKWFFINNIILNILFIICISICTYNSIEILTIFCIPYIIVIPFLIYNNIYKRWNSILDNKSLSLLFTILFLVLNIFYLLSKYIAIQTKEYMSGIILQKNFELTTWTYKIIYNLYDSGLLNYYIILLYGISALLLIFGLILLFMPEKRRIKTN